MPEDFQSLLDDLLAGREEAANLIVERYTADLVLVARRRIGSKLRRRVDPDDVIQSAYRSFFVRARNGEYTLDTAVDLWRLLVTLMLNKLRSRARYHSAERRGIDLEQSVGSGGTEAGRHRIDARAASGPGPEEAAALVDMVQAFLADLDPRDREIAELALQGYSTAEIAEHIGRTERTVRRVRQHLGERLKQKVRG